MQFLNESGVRTIWNAIKNKFLDKTTANSTYVSKTDAGNTYVKKSGDTMTGNLFVNNTPHFNIDGAPLRVGIKGGNNSDYALTVYNSLHVDRNVDVLGDLSCENATLNGSLNVARSSQFDDHVTMADCLDVSLEVTALAFFESSDISLKENIAPITKEATNAVDCLAFKQFNFKDDEDKTTKYGVIAQEVEAVGLKNLVKENKEGEKSVDYISLLILKIEALEKRIAELEAERR